MSKIKFTLTQAAVELSVSRETVRRGLCAVGISTSKGATFTMKQLFNALAGDPRRELTRLRKEQADAEARKNRIAAGELITVDDADRIHGKIVTALVQNMDRIPQIIPGLSHDQKQILLREIEACKEMGRQA